MKLKVKYLFPNIPELISQEGDSGFDVRAAIEEPIKIKPFGRVTVPTGVAVEFINQSYAPSCSAELQVRPRSGLQKMTSANRVFSCKNNGLQSKLQPVFSLAALAGQSSNDIITRLRAHRAEVLAIKEQLEFVRQKFAA